MFFREKILVLFFYGSSNIKCRKTANKGFYHCGTSRNFGDRFERLNRESIYTELSKKAAYYWNLGRGVFVDPLCCIFPISLELAMAISSADLNCLDCVQKSLKTNVSVAILIYRRLKSTYSSVVNGGKGQFRRKMVQLYFTFSDNSILLRYSCIKNLLEANINLPTTYTFDTGMMFIDILDMHNISKTHE